MFFAKNSLNLVCIRHAQSVLNERRKKLVEDPDYQQFLKLYETDPKLASEQAEMLLARHPVPWSNHEAPLTDMGRNQALITGANLAGEVKLPHVVFVSPFRRAVETLELMAKGWPALKNVPVIVDENIREREFGAIFPVGDFKLYFIKHPEQGRLFEMNGLYRYRFEQGENVPDVRSRVANSLCRVAREYRGKRVWFVSHLGAGLAVRAELENWDEERFMREDIEKHMPNCSVSEYEVRTRPHPSALKVVRYAQKLYFDP